MKKEIASGRMMVSRWKSVPARALRLFDGEVGASVVAEQGEVEDDAGDQPGFAGLLAALSVRLVEQAAEAEVG